MSAKSESCPLCGWPVGKEYDPIEEQKERPQSNQQKEQFGQNPDSINNTEVHKDSPLSSLFGYATLSAFFSIITFTAFSPHRASTGLILAFFLMFIISLALSIITIIGAVSNLSKTKPKNLGSNVPNSKGTMDTLLEFMDYNKTSIALSAISIILLLIKLIVFITY